MTCFRDGILNSLTNDDFEKFNFQKMPNSEFVLFLKKFNKKQEMLFGIMKNFQINN